MPEARFDPSANGHKAAPADRPAVSSGRGVVMVASVCALTGLNLMLGAGLGMLFGVPLGLKAPAIGISIALLAALGGALGVVFGVSVAHRFGAAAGGTQARNWGVAGGILGLVGAVAVSSVRNFPFGPVLAVLLPGLGAWLGDRLAGRIPVQGKASEHHSS
ncbi:MAG: hypothetical protein ACT4OM_08700 [Actinomycetota bacterium]